VRSCFPECEVVESLIAANNELDRRMAHSLQLWNGYFKRDGAVAAVTRTLRISIYNTHKLQEAKYRATSADEATWTLRVEGRLLPGCFCAVS
jgi:hypothetical protein